MIRIRSKNLIIVLLIASLLSIAYIVSRLNKGYYEMLPVQFEASNIPYINVTIEGMSVPLEVDLGSRLEMNLYSDVLQKFHKRSYGVERWKNFRGTQFEYPTYILPKIALESLSFKNLVVAEFPVERRGESVIWRDPEQEIPPDKTVGHLGRGFLQKMNLLLDMESSKLIITNRPKKLKEEGYDLRTFKKIPFKLKKKGIVVKVDTDLGKMKFLLDTGFTLTTVHEFLYPKNLEEENRLYDLPWLTSTDFTMNGTNFGSQDLYFLSMTKELNHLDGILGMDFIEKHVIYIDFSKKLLYIRNTEKEKINENRTEE